MYEVAKKLEGAHKEGIWTVAWRRDTLLTGGLDGEVKSWYALHLIPSRQADTLKDIRSLSSHQLGVISVDSDKRGNLVASSGLDMHIRLSQLSDGKLLKDIDTGPLETWTLCFNPEGNLVVSGSQAGNINVWNVESGAKEQSLSATGKFVMSVAVSPDGNLVASGAVDGVVQVFDLVQGRRLHTLGGHAMSVRALSFSSDSSTLLTASDGANAEAASKANLIGSFSGHASWVLSVAQNPTTKVFASGSSDRKVKIWDIGTRQCLHTFSEHTDQVWGVVWSEDGTKLVSCSDDKSIITYKTQ